MQRIERLEKGGRRMSAKFRLAAAMAGAVALAGCASTSRDGPGEAFRLAPAAEIAARTEAEIPAATARLGRYAPDGAAWRDAPRIEAAQAPFVSRSPIGRRFLAAPTPRALALGDPPAICPAAALVAGPPGAARAAVAGRALDACLASLGERGMAASCGCRVVAVDDLLLAPLEAFAYAGGVGGRLVGDGRFGGKPLIAEEANAPDGRGVRIAFYDAAGPVALGDLGDDGAARLLMLEDGAVFTGWREPWGWRRGRVQERLLLEGADGERLIALIGFEPADVAAEGPALAAWPKG
jgi:hypothetical protein